MQDVQGGLKAITGGTRAKYESIFTAIQPELPTVVDQLGELQDGLISQEFAEYPIVRDKAGTKYVYPIYLIRCEDGVWRIDGM